MKPGKTYTLIAVEHPQPDPPEQERKECRKLKPTSPNMDLCENCLGPVRIEATQCRHCEYHLTGTITWAEYVAQRDC